MHKKKYILVTGSHRSGSTWTGDILSASSKVRYIHEPFNIGINPNSPLKYWYQYIDKNEEASNITAFLNQYFKTTPRERVKYLSKVRKVKDFTSYVNKYILGAEEQLLVKDPIMFFSAEWFAKKYNASVIITVRHPAAFVASLKVKNWMFDFYNFSEQEQLMERLTEEMKEKVVLYSNEKPNIIETGILLWNIIHHIILQYKASNPDWIIVRHEDLSDNPIDEFKAIFSKLSIPYNSYIESKIIDSTQANEDNNLKRNASENKESWKKRLSDDEIDLILSSTKSIAHQFGY